jgi:hypothetical protein
MMEGWGSEKRKNIVWLSAALSFELQSEFQEWGMTAVLRTQERVFMWLQQHPFPHTTLTMNRETFFEIYSGENALMGGPALLLASTAEFRLR